MQMCLELIRAKENRWLHLNAFDTGIAESHSSLKWLLAAEAQSLDACNGVCGKLTCTLSGWEAVLALRKDFVSVWSTLYIHVYNNYKCREYIICDNDNIICDNDNSAKCEEQKEVGMTQIETCIQKHTPQKKGRKKREDKIPWLIN